jgi:DNA-binding PadR family transcriptional regulator
MPLDKLTSKGFVDKALSEPTLKRGGRSKCLYTLTRRGKKALEEIRKVQEALWAELPEPVFD